jgi:hypothetical protein
MAVPTYLANNFNFLETSGVTDVSTTITRLVAQAVALVWTNPGAGHVVSPPNAVGQYIDLQFNRIAATNLEMVFTDSLTRTFTRRAQVTAAWTERIYFNTYGMLLDFSNGEGFWATLLDLSPELQNSHDQFATGNGARTSGGVLDSFYSTHGSEQLSSANPRVYALNSANLLVPRGNIQMTAPPQGMQALTQSGGRLWYPNIQVGPVTAAIWRVRGRVFQMLMVYNSESNQSEITVPIDQATTGVFKITSVPIVAGNNFDGKMAMRKA